jgi:hypothetical protein
MGRTKTTVYLEPELLRAAKVEAARSGKREYEVFEEALRSYLGFEVLERAWVRSDLTEEEALELAYREVHEARR